MATDLSPSVLQQLEEMAKCSPYHHGFKSSCESCRVNLGKLEWAYRLALASLSEPPGSNSSLMLNSYGRRCFDAGHAAALSSSQESIEKVKQVPRQMTVDREQGYDHLVWLSDVLAIIDPPSPEGEK